MASMCRTIRRSIASRVKSMVLDKPKLSYAIGRKSAKSLDLTKLKTKKKNWFMRLIEKIAKWLK